MKQLRQAGATADEIDLPRDFHPKLFDEESPAVGGAMLNIMRLRRQILTSRSGERDSPIISVIRVIRGSG